MSSGQGVLGSALLDVGELNRIGDRIEARESRRSTEHAEQLTDALALHRALDAAGMGLSTAAHLALLLGCSEHRATCLLAEARVLQRLGALEPMRRGLMTVEQARVVSDLLGPVPDDALAAVLWERLHQRLVLDREHGDVRPPARVRELLRRWLIAADPAGAAERTRQEADDTADVELWRRDSGLVDLVLRSLTAAEAQACVDRIEEAAHGNGGVDDRSAGMRRQNAARDLLLGRMALPFDPVKGPVLAGCCPPGSAAPCGAHVFVHVSLEAADGGSADPAELVGHGPVDGHALRNLLTSGAVLHRVWVDGYKVPVAVDDRTWRPGRGDPAAVRQALQDMRSGSPPAQFAPRHPSDHSPEGVSTVDVVGPRVVRRPHLSAAGGYVPPPRLKQLLRARAPRCEWPGCGRRASRAAATGCDLDHDVAWPFGPTCACNLGPMCRRHHRIKQLGWLKDRRADGSVGWTSPSGRTWTSPNQHARPVMPPGRREVAAGVWRIPLAA